MDSLNALLNLAKAGHFRNPVERPGKPLAAVSPATPTEPLPEPNAAPATRLWLIRRNGRRFLVEFTEPQTRAELLEQAARNRPGEPVELEPALLLPALRSNAFAPVDKSENVNRNEPLQQQTLLPDNAIAGTGPEVLTVSAAELLQAAGVSVRYLNEPAQAAAALAELVTLPDNGSWGLDIETAPLPAFRQDPKAGLDPWRSAIRLVQVYPGGNTCFVFDVATIGLSPLRELLQARAFVAHNGTFEFKHLFHAGAAPARLDCTLLQDNALSNKRRALAAVAAERLGWQMDKTLQVSDWAGGLSAAQLDYAALDAVAAYRLAGIQAAALKDRGLGRCYALMRGAQPAITRLELAGCPFNAAAHTALIEQWQAAAEQARNELDSLLNGANPDSPAQLAKWLAANLPLDTLAAWPKTPSGQLSTDADTLAGLTLPALEPLARYKAAVKGLSTYGKGYAGHISPVTGRIHASFLLGGAESGRLSCQNPNIQNPPRDPAFRALFAPSAGRVMVVADYSQIELRVAALVSGDSAMLAAYEQGQDLHRKTAAAVLGIEPGAVTKAQRQMAKACIAAGSLVLTDKGLVPIEQVTQNHLLWDGVSWVPHDGVVYQGYQQVMTYEGLTATPDHVVFLETGETRLFTQAANSGGLSLARGEFEGYPVRFLGSSRGTGNRTGNGYGNPDTAAVIGALFLPHYKENQVGSSGKPATEPVYRGTGSGESEVPTGIPRPGGTITHSNTGNPLRCYSPTLQQSELRMVPSLRRAGYPATVQESGTLCELDTDEPTPRNLSGCPNRPDRQQSTLRTRQLAAGIAATELTEHAAQSLLPLPRNEGSSCGLMAFIEDRLPRLQLIPHADGETSSGGRSCSGNPGAETETQYAHVYDILNAGPRNRFTVSGYIVHNCNFGLLYGQGAKGLQAYAKASYGVDMSLAEADKARAAFFKAYPGLSTWQKQQQEQARFAKQVRTPGGRCRALDGARLWATASLNTPIQGGAAECLLAALAALELDSLGGRLVNIIHDELVVECGPEQAAAVAAEVERAMVAGFLSIFPEGCTRDLVEAHAGENWAAAKG